MLRSCGLIVKVLATGSWVIQSVQTGKILAGSALSLQRILDVMPQSCWVKPQAFSFAGFVGSIKAYETVIESYRETV